MATEKKASKADQIAGLIEEYNQAESEAFNKLVKIFYILKKGKGMRRIEFDGAGVLTNCWGSPDRLDSKLYLDSYNRKIKAYQVADPESIE